jgi:hypothetical protein
MPEFAGDVTLCRSGSQGKTIARLHPVVSRFAPIPSSRIFHLVILVWFFGWGFLLLKFPARCYRIGSRSKTPNAKQLKRAVFVGYMGLFFGCLFLLELAFGLVPSTNRDASRPSAP